VTVNRKREDISRDDLLSVGREMSIKNCGIIIDEVVAAVSTWPEHARDAGVPPPKITSIGRYHRLM